MGGRVGRGALLVVVAALAILIVSCSNGDDAGGAPATAASTSAVETSTTVTTTSMTAPVESSTTASTSVTTTTAASTTTETVPPEVALEAEVAEAYDERYDGYWACVRAPADCDFGYLLPDGSSEAALRVTLQSLLDRDRFVGDDDVGTYTIQVIEVTGDEAVVDACWWSTAVLYTTPADPTQPPSDDNPPSIVNNTPGTVFSQDTFVRVSDRWLLSSSTVLSEHPEENRCGG